MAAYEVTISRIDLDFSTSIDEIGPEARSAVLSGILARTWFLVVEADEALTGPLCQHISNQTGCLVRDVEFTVKSAGE